MNFNSVEFNTNPGMNALAYSDIAPHTVKSGIEAIIARATPAYFELMQKARAKPEIISDYKKSLYTYYSDKQSMTPEMIKRFFQHN